MFGQSGFGTSAPNAAFGFGNAPAANANPFGQSQLFGKPATAGFGGASTSTFGQPANASLFPSSQPQTANLFQNANTTFGAPPSTQSGFAGSTLFGQQQPSTNTNFFNTPATTFGQQNKPTGFGFSSPSSQPSLFSQPQPQPQQTASSMFQPSTSNLFGGGATSFGAGQQQQLGTVIKFNPVTGTDTMMKNGTATSINTKHMSITCMKEYENKSFEELRLEDYMAGRTGPQQQSGFGAAPFSGGGGTVSSAPSLFGQTDNTKPAFGQSTFGQTASTFGQSTAFGLGTQQPQQSTNLFGKPTGFGAPTSSTSFGFGSAQTNSNLFGSNQVKPFGSPSQPLFGTNTNTTQSGFGGGLFGQTNTQNTTASLFGKPSQPATGNVFGAPQNASFTFSTPSTTSTSLFMQNKPLFGQSNTNTGFGQTNTFGTATSFAKPATTAFGTAGQGTAFGSTLGGIQPQGTSLFGNTAAKPGGLFGTTNTTGLFGNTNNSFQPSTGIGLQQQPQQTLFPNAETSNPLNIELLKSDPFGDAPHLAGLEPKLKKNQSVSVTDPKELKTLLDASRKVDTSHTGKLKVIPIKSVKSNLFEGISSSKLSDDDILISDQMKPNCRRLIIKSRPNSSFDNKVLNHSDILKHLFSPEQDEENNTNKIIPIKSTEPSSLSSSSNVIKELKIPKLKLNFDDTEINVQQSGINSKDGRTIDEDNCFISNKNQSSDLDQIDDIFPQKNQLSTPTISNQHPCGIKCTRPEYYTLPTLEELPQYLTEDGQKCIVKGFTIGRKGYGNVYFPDEINIINLNIDEIVHFRYREINLYPIEDKKPPIGEGLNRRAQVTLDNVYPRKSGSNKLIKDVNELIRINFAEKLRKITLKKDAKFVDYRPETGSWVFKVNHFSRYGFNESDESDEEEDGVKKLRLESEKKPLKSVGETEFKSEKKPSKNQEESEFNGLKTVKNRTEKMDEFDFDDEESCDVLSQSMYVDNEETFTNYDFDRFKLSKNIQVMKSSLFMDDDRLSEVSEVASSRCSIVRQFFDLPHEVVTTTPSLDLFKDEVVRKRRGVVKPRVESVFKFAGSATKHELIPCRNVQDVCAFKGKSFKVGWFKGFNYFDVNSDVRGQINFNKIVSYGNSEMDPLQNHLTEVLETTLDESTFELDHNNIPTFTISRTVNYLSKQTKIFTELCRKNSTSKRNNLTSKYLHDIWTLAEALWIPYKNNTSTDRRYLLSEWLKNCTKKNDINNLATIFDYLTVFDTTKASELAMENNLPNLSLLIAQLTNTNITKFFLQEQIELWYKTNAIDYINCDMKKMYLMLSGTALKGDCNVFDNLDWLRAFGVHFWFISPSGSPIDSSIELYENSFKNVGYAIEPRPPYRAYNYNHLTCSNGNNDESFNDDASLCLRDIQKTDESACDDDNGVYDVMYHMLVLYRKKVYRLCKVLDPVTHTSDRLDYRLSFLLLQLFQSLQVGIIEEQEKTKVYISFANQLETLNQWQWSIFILLNVKDNEVKKNLIIKILERNLSDENDKNTLTVQNFLINKLKIPTEWVHSVKGEKSLILNNNYFQAFNHMILSKNYNTSNDILLQHLIPNLFINEQYDLIKILIKKISEGRDGILNYDNEVGLFNDFIDMQNCYLTNDRDDRLKLLNDLELIVDRIGLFDVKNDQQKLCMSEMSKRCVFICKELCASFNELKFLGDGILERLLRPACFKSDDVMYLFD